MENPMIITLFPDDFPIWARALFLIQLCFEGTSPIIGLVGEKS